MYCFATFDKKSASSIEAWQILMQNTLKKMAKTVDTIFSKFFKNFHLSELKNNKTKLHFNDNITNADFRFHGKSNDI